MAKQYLSKENIKWLRDYLNNVLPPKVRAVLLQVKLRTGFEPYVSQKDNIRYMWQIYNDELKNSAHPSAIEFRTRLANANPAGAGVILESYIADKYQKEWDVICTFNPEKIDRDLNYIDGFKMKNYIGRIDLRAVIESQSIDEFLSQYDIKNCDPELIKKTETLAKTIETFFKDIQPGSPQYNELLESVNVYLANKDIQKLHNLLNKN